MSVEGMQNLRIILTEISTRQSLTEEMTRIVLSNVLINSDSDSESVMALIIVTRDYGDEAI